MVSPDLAVHPVAVLASFHVMTQCHAAKMNRIAALLSTLAIAGVLPVAESRPAVASVPAAARAACVTIPAVAHRGGTERYAENSADAFRDASNRGVPSWETDVQFTSDDVPVIMHDATVDRTTDGTGLVADLTFGQIAALHTDDGQPVPTLAQLVNDAEVDGARIFPELKTMPSEPQWTAFIATLGMRPTIAPKITITSFDGNVLLAAAAHTSLYTTGLIAELGDQSPASVTQWGAHVLIKHHNAITAGRMAAWTAGGLSVYSWTVDTASEWERMSWYPALAGVITDTPGAYLTWQRGRVC
jgi:glycerophosphoryl diester phosphodiesterase